MIQQRPAACSLERHPRRPSGASPSPAGPRVESPATLSSPHGAIPRGECADLRPQSERFGLSNSREGGTSAGSVCAWPKLLHNLRASRQSELAAKYPLADVCRWMGNSPAVAARHYLMARDHNFAEAIRTPTAAPLSITKTQNPTQTASEPGGQQRTGPAGPIAQVA